MRYASISTSARLLGAALLACCIQAGIAMVLTDEQPMKSTNDNTQLEDDMPKRDWNKELHIWGKRAWNNLHGGWGLKRSVPSSSMGDEAFQGSDKRAWQNLHQGGWGKRATNIPDDEYDEIRRVASMIDQFQLAPQYGESDVDSEFLEPNDDEKRNWGQFHGGWGKRSKWDKFRGGWGKREPAWSNLKGIWGKRSITDQIAQ